MAYASSYYGGAAVTVIGAATVIDGTSIYCKVGEQKAVSVTANQALDSLTLTVVFETKNRLDVTTIANAQISRSSTTATFTIPTDATTLERTLSWSLRRTDTSEKVASGLLFVTYDAQVD